MKKILFILLLLPTTCFAQEESAQSAQPLLEALRECVAKQEAALAEQKILNEGLTEVRSRVRQIDINILGIKNTTQQLVVANGHIERLGNLFNQIESPAIKAILGLAVFGLVAALFIIVWIVNAMFGWATKKKEA